MVTVIQRNPLPETFQTSLPLTWILLAWMMRTIPASGCPAWCTGPRQGPRSLRAPLPAGKRLHCRSFCLVPCLQDPTSPATLLAWFHRAWSSWPWQGPPSQARLAHLPGELPEVSSEHPVQTWTLMLRGMTLNFWTSQSWISWTLPVPGATEERLPLGGHCGLSFFFSPFHLRWRGKGRTQVPPSELYICARWPGWCSRGLLREDIHSLAVSWMLISELKSLKWECAPLRDTSLHQDGGTFGEQSSQGYWFPFEGMLLCASRSGCSEALNEQIPFLPSSVYHLPRAPSQAAGRG